MLTFLEIYSIEILTNGDELVKNGLSLRATIDFLGLWEELNNSEVNMVEIDQFNNHTGSNAFTMSLKNE